MVQLLGSLDEIAGCVAHIVRSIEGSSAAREGERRRKVETSAQSVKRCAESRVTTAVPAEPVNLWMRGRR